MKKEKLGGKDLITIGIYTALYIVALFVACVANITPITFMFYPAVAAFLGAAFFMVLAVKVKKVGGIIIWGIIVGLLFFALGMGMTFPFFVVGSIIAQIIVTKTKYNNLNSIMIAYVIVSIFSIGGYLQLFAFTDQYLAEASARGLANEYVEGLASCATVPFLLIIIAVTGVCAVLGNFIGRAIFKKHLKKAGVL